MPILIALRPYLFDAFMKKLLLARKTDFWKNVRNFFNLPEDLRKLILQCYKAADVILDVNAYITHASWLAATVKLLQERLEEDGFLKEMARLAFNVLKSTHNESCTYWDMSRELRQNLDSFERRLQDFSAISMTRFLHGDSSVSLSLPAGPPNSGFSQVDDSDRPNETVQPGCFEWYPALRKDTGPRENSSPIIAKSPPLLQARQCDLGTGNFYLGLEDPGAQDKPVGYTSKPPHQVVGMQPNSFNSLFHPHINTSISQSGAELGAEREASDTVRANDTFLDWQSLFTDTEIGQELNDDVEIFSQIFSE